MVCTWRKAMLHMVSVRAGGWHQNFLSQTFRCKTLVQNFGTNWCAYSAKLWSKMVCIGCKALVGAGGWHQSFLSPAANQRHTSTPVGSSSGMAHAHSITITSLVSCPLDDPDRTQLCYNLIRPPWDDNMEILGAIFIRTWFSPRRWIIIV